MLILQYDVEKYPKKEILQMAEYFSSKLEDEILLLPRDIDLLSNAPTDYLKLIKEKLDAIINERESSK